VVLKKNNLLECLTEKPMKDESLHGVRKILRDFQYCWQYIRADVQALLPAGLAAKDKIKEATDRIGRFHDTAVALNLLGENCSEGIVSDDEMGSILNIRKDWQDNKEALRRQVSSQLESCFN